MYQSHHTLLLFKFWTNLRSENSADRMSSCTDVSRVDDLKVCFCLQAEVRAHVNC